ncbi:MAG: hypothetical protein AAGC70_04205 [Pseudomonadota bacterium]
MFTFLNKLRGEWRLVGWDTFAGHEYGLPGRYRTQASAVRAAKRELRRIEKQQPTATSGGQDGIQDRVYIISPEGQSIRVLPD